MEQAISSIPRDRLAKLNRQPAIGLSGDSNLKTPACPFVTVRGRFIVNEYAPWSFGTPSDKASAGAQTDIVRKGA